VWGGEFTGYQGLCGVFCVPPNFRAVKRQSYCFYLMFESIRPQGGILFLKISRGCML